EFAASGAFAEQTVRLNSLTASASPGLRVSANGTIPISGSGLSVNLDAEAPLSIANRFLADRGTQVTGTATFDGSIAGSISEPAIDGSFSTRSASVVDPETNVRLGSIDVAGTVSGQTVTIQSASAALATGGTISAGGTISLDT